MARWRQPWMPAGLLRVLEIDPGPPLAPLRMEIFGAERLRQHAASLGQVHRLQSSGAARGSFHPRLHNNVRALRAAHAYLSAQTRDGQDQGPVAEWMLDNFHLIEAQMEVIREGLPAHFYRSLPLLCDAPLAGLPRIYSLAWSFVGHTDSAFDEGLLLTFLQAYQDVRELGQGELWALPTTLRIVMLENLRRLSDRMVGHLAAREMASHCAQRLQGLTLPVVQQLAARMASRGVGRVFQMHLLQRLAGQPLAAEPERVREWLVLALPDLPTLLDQVHAEQAADLLSVGNAVSALRLIGAADWSDLVARSSRVMALLMTAPVFAAEDEATRNTTLHGIERLAVASGEPESVVARVLLLAMERAPGDADDPRHLAVHWLHGDGQIELRKSLGLPAGLRARWRRLPRPSATQVYLVALAAGTLALTSWLLHRWAAVDAVALIGWNAVLLGLPASEVVSVVLSRLVSESVKPAHVPRLGLPDGIPAQARVLVAIPAMLSDVATIDGLAHRLRLHYLANPEACAQFALLSDWNDAATASAPGDRELLQHAQDRVAALNREHPAIEGDVPRFLLLHRDRCWSDTQRCWLGHERKRGKLQALVARLATGGPGPFLPLGDLSRTAPHTRYLLTLDSDTWLPPGRLRALVGVAEHPANRPQLDADRRRVCRGYGIIQPRLVAPLPSARHNSFWQWLGQARQGLDPYSAMASDLYQDVWGEGSFTGKGLLHVATVHAVLGDRLPGEAVLSHDLLEGALVRCAVVSDIVLLEPEPEHADAASARLHRWMRGDWQLLPMLLAPRAWPMAGISRWKLADNLRRTLVAPASLALLLLAMTGQGLSLPVALALVLAAHSAGPAMAALSAWVPHRLDRFNIRFVTLATADLWRTALAGLWALSQLPAQALSAADAALRTVYRLTASRRHLLEWSTSAAHQSGLHSGMRGTLRRQRMPLALALLMAAGVVGIAPGSGLLALALAGLWVAAPLLSWLAHRPWPLRPALKADDRAFLLGVARDTWALFEHSVDARNHHLPPDNLQTDPVETVAHRTSPTNIGLYLLSVCCARAFGWIGTQELIDRMQATLTTLHRMERHRGHFLNWYDTETLQPLLPRYVSTVDSGNLSAHLLAVARACLERADDPARDVADGPVDPATGIAPPAASPAGWRDRLRELAGECQRLAWAPAFGFLHHPRRRLLHIGYRVDDGALDPSLYDLLASEARTTSLLAIARGDVPLRHWAALGRPWFASGRHAVLSSWSGSMFEYLMPLLVNEPPRGSALHEAFASAVREQRAFARGLGLAWGMSECAHAGRDTTLAYQYAPQGVPHLALRRTPANECVVAPYASVLAAQVDAASACRNLRALAALGARGRFGFIEAVDHTPARQVHGSAFTLVSTFMAHHQGMSLAALANVLLDGAVQRWGMAEPRLQALSALLHEQAPREMHAGGPARAATSPRSLRSAEHSRPITPGGRAIPPTHLLGNGRYTVALRPNGAGWSRWSTIGISRWRDDALRDEHGSFLYLRASADAVPVSLTSHPAPDDAARYTCEFHADRVGFSAEWPGLHAHTTVWVSPEDDVELRKVVLSNPGGQAQEVELISALEIALADPAADEAHPAFSNLFVRADWLPAQQAVRFERTPRRDAEPGALAAHFVASVQGELLQLRCQSDRLHWRGRLHPASHPLAHLRPAPADACALDTGLDPVAALGLTLRLPPGGHACVVFATAASDAASTLAALIDKYREPGYVARSSVMSATLAAIASPPHRPHADYLPAMQALTTALVLTLAPTRAPPGQAHVIDRRALWPLGLSGERPIVLVDAATRQGLGLLRLLAGMLGTWARAGVGCDLVVISLEAHSYDMPLQRELLRLREQHLQAPAQHVGAQGTGLHVWRADELLPAQRATLRALARVVLLADGQPLLHQVRDWCLAHEPEATPGWRDGNGEPTPLAVRWLARAPRQAAGGFDADGRRYRIELDNAAHTPRPWVNVLANPGFGTLVSESGGGNTWARNSRLHQLTVWANDPVADTPSEWFWLQDRQSRAAWSLTPSAWGHGKAPYRVTHTQGLTTMEHAADGLRVTMHCCVDRDSAIKQVRVTVTNQGPRKRHLRLLVMVEWLLGERRADRATLHTGAHHGEGPGTPLLGLFCTQQRVDNTQAHAQGGPSAFLAEVPHGQHEGSTHDDGLDWTCDRRAFFDSAGRIALPRHLGRAHGSVDPCAAHARLLTVRPGATLQQTYLIGHAEHMDAALALLGEARAVDPLRREQAVRERWDVLLGASEVHTPDPLFDALVNRWLLYQTVSSRLWAKAGFYQAGGATGFRDQLQDTMALAWAEPALLREQILRCAAHQFEAGDVQHWWHEPGGAGVRTHFSDDRLWLPWACAHHLRTTGDSSVLDEPVPFLVAPELPLEAEDAYDTPRVSAQQASVYEHAARAIDHSLRTGMHGLPLMGTGDWNDGMNRVGHGGRGESVWLAWFLCAITEPWIALARKHGDNERAQRWALARAGWAEALQGPAWDGAWYRRAFFDDGSPLGAQGMPEARIDLIAQAWAVLSGQAPPERQRLAMAAARAQLHDAPAGLMRLLTPPLRHAAPSAGYIQAYPPGVRENGGQYAHAAVWALMASARLVHEGEGPIDPTTPPGGPDLHGQTARDRVYADFCELSPAHRAAHPVWGPLYGLEPYAMAADVYSEAPWRGRGGWSWYTGAAGWMHRAAIESIFGLQIAGDELWFEPCLPGAWPRARLTLRRGQRRLHFLLHRGDATTTDGPAMGIGARLRWRDLPDGIESRFSIRLD
ncbi:GH36-type glycosyl hydrolase domain-containing protein [Hydrogenophaga sp. T2]|uniref:GH36-type glycosyl hydrolase domain-containing protein n=1 Tax=Hydrogenophaga sp. T2 TaxID=3132823 RepID=UPI003CFA009D